MRSRLTAALLALPLALAACTPAPSPSEPTTPSSPPKVELARTAGVQLFQWNWNSVAKECTEVLGPNAFDFVLLSPAQEHIEGEQWWTSYQPVSYQIESKLGTRDEFKAMVDTCHGAGVKIYADAVINHMTGIDGGTGVAGSAFTHYDYPGIYTEADFHKCETVTGDIENYSDQVQVQTCELSNLADLKTDTEHVQTTIAAYLNDLRSLGVDGFRIDAAKHMPARDVKGIVDRIDGDPFVAVEVIRGSGEPIQPEDYLDSGSAFAFQFARDLTGLIPGGAVYRALDLYDGELPSEKAVTFVTNHDTERNGQTTTYKDGAEYHLANLLMMAVDFGTPTLYAGYAFNERDAGAPQTDGKIDDVECTTSEDPQPGEWVCGHRRYAGLAEWAAVVGDAEAKEVWREGYAVAFERGDRGVFVINGNSSRAVTAQFPTQLPDGTYCDVATQPTTVDDSEPCGGTILGVLDGVANVEVPPMDGVAVHVNRRHDLVEG
ncbi:MAG TPA: alpha-amylase family protein [Tessaracoccus flavescens]|uniref:Alpha-amylase n=1 Tax=Tessaracoccus flavescens TaxID=399497 RepID=A0A921EM69_9ACTN|nr:alpha-amylase family protein [Tessaracoccus flavescens]